LFVRSDAGEKEGDAKTKGGLGATEARLAAMEAPLGEPGEFCPGATASHAQPKDLEKSQLHQRCKAWIQTIYSKISDANELAENFCKYGGFLTAEKRKLAVPRACQPAVIETSVTLRNVVTNSCDAVK